MRLFYSLHALERLDERDITREEVLAVWHNRETLSETVINGRRSMVILGRTPAGRRLKLILAADDEYYVITVADRGSEG